LGEVACTRDPLSQSGGLTALLVAGASVAPVTVPTFRVLCTAALSGETHRVLGIRGCGFNVYVFLEGIGNLSLVLLDSMSGLPAMSRVIMVSSPWTLLLVPSKFLIV
jgi:hypothetical protein